jgi:hypothetical protein
MAQGVRNWLTGTVRRVDVREHFWIWIYSARTIMQCWFITPYGLGNT